MITEKKIRLKDNGKELAFSVRALNAWDGLKFGQRFGRLVSGALADGKTEGVASLLAREKDAPMTVEDVRAMIHSFASILHGVDLAEFVALEEIALTCVYFHPEGGTPRAMDAEEISAVLVDPFNVAELVVESFLLNTRFFADRIPGRFRERFVTRFGDAARNLSDSTQTAKSAQS